MPRKRVVTRTIGSFVYQVLVADIEKQVTFVDSYDMGPKLRTVGGVLAEVDRRLGPAYKALKVMGRDKTVTRYVMDEEKFMQLAEKIPVDQQLPQMNNSSSHIVEH